MQRAWMSILLTACWTPSSSPPASSPHAPAGGATAGERAGTSTAEADALPPPRAPLDGRLRIRPAVYCGGARRPDHYQAPPLAPVPGITLEVHAGARHLGARPVAQVVTDGEGRFTASLPAGTYCLVRAGRGARPVSSPGPETDLRCLVERWESCEAVVDVPVATAVSLDIQEPCAWSVCYHGPPPP